MTDPQRHPGKHPRGPFHWPARFGLGLLALAVLALPFYAAAEYYQYVKYMSNQVSTPQAEIRTEDAASWSGAARTLPATSAPVVLAYHDIGHAPSDYTVTPHAFDEQLTALERAGYRSLTTDEFVAYLKGEPAPPRSVYITFDDGPNGLWVYGDRILARHHMHGAVFLITGSVDRRPYYLSWREIARMQSSGRWDFQDHTHNLHHRAPVDAQGHEASALANPLWLPKLHRVETQAEYETRIRADLRRSFKDFADHGLPVPQLFAFPFSEATEQPNMPAANQSLQKILAGRFTATMTNVSARPLPASRRAAAAQQVQRLEVVKSTTASQLITKVTRWTQVAPQVSAPLTQPRLWTHNDGTKLQGTGAFTGTGPYPANPSVRYVSASYRSMSSVDWTNYEVDTRIAALGDGTNQGTVRVRNGSDAPVSISVSQFLTVSVPGRKNLVKPLPPGPSHILRITVRDNTTAIVADGSVHVTVPATGTPAKLAGGIALSAGINRPGTTWPRFTSLRIIDIADQSRDVNGVRQRPVSGTALLGPNAPWVSSPGVKAPFEITSSQITPQGRTLSAYGAYRPDATARWDGYTLFGTITRLTGTQVSGALWVRVGSPLAISVRVYWDHLDVYSGNADNQALVTTRRLTRAATHSVAITVTAEHTLITADDSTNLSLIAKGETGGVGFSAYRDLTRRSWPTAQNLRVTATGEAS